MIGWYGRTEIRRWKGVYLPPCRGKTDLRMNKAQLDIGLIQLNSLEKQGVVAEWSKVLHW